MTLACSGPIARPQKRSLKVVHAKRKIYVASSPDGALLVEQFMSRWRTATSLSLFAAIFVVMELKLEWLLAILVIAVGSIGGYLVRTMISRRRRRWSQWESWREARYITDGTLAFRLESPACRNGTAQPNNDPIREITGAPNLEAPNPSLVVRPQIGGVLLTVSRSR